MTSAEWVLSVDFGTSNTAAAHSAALSGAIESLSLSHTSNLMSSAVFVDAPDRIAVGDHAANEAQRNPAAFIPAPKRLVGQESISVNGYTLTTWMPIAAVLGAVLSRATAIHAGQMPARVVVTHPEAWSPTQVRVLIDAASAAGVHPSTITTISEPRAAAAHYARSADLPVGATIAVFDFGGGTLDVAVLVKGEDGAFVVKAARGDNGLGGKNFDALIRRWVDQQLAARSPELAQYLRRSAPPGIRHQLDESIRRAKELLSEAPSATITAAGGGFHETLQITRDEFDELIESPLRSAAALTRDVLNDAGIHRRDDLTALYLTGGTSRIPLVHRTLQQLGPVATLDDPKTVVAQGALAAAGVGSSRPPVLPDVDDLMAQWESAPTTPTRASARSAPEIESRPQTSRRGRAVLAGAAALVVVAALVGGVLAFTARGGDGGTSDTSLGQPGQSSGTAPSGSGRATTPEQIMAALPQRLSSALRSCTKAADGPSGVPQISCSIADDSGLTTGLLTQNSRISLSADREQAQTDVVRIRQGSLAGDDTVIENTARTAAASVRQPSGTSAELTYANTNTYVRAYISGVLGPTEAKTFLTRSELIE